MNWIRMSTANDTCPGIREFVKSTMRCVRCRLCGGDLKFHSMENLNH